MSSTPDDLIIKLPEFVRDLASIVLGEPYCYDEIIGRLNFNNIDCLKLGISKGLGLVIVLGGCIVKLPQILKIIKAGSAKGISFLSYFLETTSYIVSIAYNLRANNPFSTWGETLAITFQNGIILALMMAYSGQTIGAGILLIGAFGFYSLLTDSTLINAETLGLLQACTIPVTLFSRVPQIVSNYKNGHTGQLSAFTIFNYFFGTLARVFTTIQEVNDNLILIGFLLAFFLNTVLAGQMAYYWKASPIVVAKKEQ